MEAGERERAITDLCVSAVNKPKSGLHGNKLQGGLNPGRTGRSFSTVSMRFAVNII